MRKKYGAIFMSLRDIEQYKVYPKCSRFFTSFTSLILIFPPWSDVAIATKISLLQPLSTLLTKSSLLWVLRTCTFILFFGLSSLSFFLILVVFSSNGNDNDDVQVSDRDKTENRQGHGKKDGKKSPKKSGTQSPKKTIVAASDNDNL